MKIFISWSGSRSGACAKALHDWLPCVMQTVIPWCSSQDIAKGARGLDDIAVNLDEANFGIVCLTPSNLRSEWINFESGALSKKFGSSALFTFLLDLQPSDITPPLGLFQHTHASKEDTFKLVQSINAKTEKPLGPDILFTTFTALWPKLELAISELPPDLSPNQTARTQKEILEEILSTVRSLTQTKSDGSEAIKKRVTNLANFADGCLQGRGHKAPIGLRIISDDEAMVQITLEGKKHDFPISLTSPIVATRNRIVGLVKDTISEDDIPF